MVSRVCQDWRDQQDSVGRPDFVDLGGRRAQLVPLAIRDHKDRRFVTVRIA